MRIAIREQLAALVIFAVLVALAIVSIPTWIYVHNFVVGVESEGLSLTASLKASRIASEIDLFQTICQTVATRILLQQAFVTFYNENASGNPFESARADLRSAMSTTRVTGVLQAKLYSRNSTGNPRGIFSITGTDIDNQGIELPYRAPNGSKILLGDSDLGFPPSLYPNLTYQALGYPNPYVPSTPAYVANAFPGVRLNDNGGMLLGPLVVNESFALISITVPVISVTIAKFILGYLTLVGSASSLLAVQASREGLSSTGQALLIGPSSPSNRFNSSLTPSNGTYSPPKTAFAASSAQFVLPPVPVPGQSDRHSIRGFEYGGFGRHFAVSQYPALFDVYYRNNSQPNNATAILSTTNEQGVPVAVGIARPQSTLVDWAVIVEKSAAEAYEPIQTLRTILLGCVFGTACLVVILVFPCAHLSVKPISRLKSATEKSISPPGYEDDAYVDYDDEDPSSGGTLYQRSPKGFFATIRRRVKKHTDIPAVESSTDAHRRVFKIPAKVQDRKHYVTDELTELTQTFNEMSDELLKQYTSLDEKVAERTGELEISKRAAEAANESKTLFIANLSHELKTPLNGIMGMTAVCMEEDSIVRIKQSLKTLYRSGDSLLHLLEDLLSFSKNQIDHHVSLEERLFRLGDIRSQILSIFDKQVRENKINFSVLFPTPESIEAAQSANERNSLDNKLPTCTPAGVGRLKDMCLWGDQHRILQVIINLVSNSLKFTPAGGKVELRIRCVGEVERNDESIASSFIKNGSARPGRSRHRSSASTTHSNSTRAGNKGTGTPIRGRGTALEINPADPPKASPHVYIRERSPTPPPANAKTFIFAFEIEDTGAGIPESMQEKIFEPFVQGDLGLSKKYGGTGLGLSICAQLAQLMGGCVGVRSTLGVGSVFTMQIPLKYVKERASSSASSSLNASRPTSVASSVAAGDFPVNTGDQKASNTTSVLEDEKPRLVGLSAPFFASNSNPSPKSAKDHTAALDKAMANRDPGEGRLRVLVADDNTTNVEVVSRMLKLEDIYDVTIAKDGQEAYELVKANMEKKQHFDVIFMDIQMPNLDGLQSTRLIRKMGYAAPIVALTAFSEESNVKECMESGMDEFLSKPIRRPALKKVLTKFATIPEESEMAKANLEKTLSTSKEKEDL